MARSVEIMKEFVVSSNQTSQSVVFLIRCFHLPQLHTAGIEHHTHRLSHGLRRKVVTEEHTNHSIGSVSLRNLTPNAAVVRTVLHGLSLHVQETDNTYFVDISDTLSKIEFCILGSVHSLNLDEALVFILSNLASMSSSSYISTSYLL